MDKLVFGIEKKRLTFLTCDWIIEPNKEFKEYTFDKKHRNMHMNLSLYYVKDDNGEELVFQMKGQKNGEDVLRFTMKQVIKLISADVAQGRVTFFLIDEELIPKPGIQLKNDIFKSWLKLFIKNASADSLKGMIAQMNQHHQRMKNKVDDLKENNSNSNKQATVKPNISTLKKIDLSADSKVLSRKQKLKAFMSGDPKLITKHIQQQRKIEESGVKEEDKKEFDLNPKIDSSKCYIINLPDELLLCIFNFTSSVDLNEMKKTNKTMYELIASKRKKLVFNSTQKAEIPFEILKKYIYQSVNLEELHIPRLNLIPSSHIMALEKMNLLHLKKLNIIGWAFSQGAIIRMVIRWKNIEDLRINLNSKIDDSLFFQLRNLSKLKNLTLGTSSVLNSTLHQSATDVVNLFSKHIEHYNLSSLNIYGLTEKIMTAYSKTEEKANLIQTLKFGHCLEKSYDLLNDLIFFPNLKNLEIWYQQSDCAQSDIDMFNNELIGSLLLEVWINLESLTIGGLLNDDGAKHIAESMNKHGKLAHIRILNSPLKEDGLYTIIEKAYELRSIDITGCLLCSTGEAFIRERGYNTHLLKSITMSVVSTDKLRLSNTLRKIYGDKIQLSLTPVTLKKY